MPTCSKCHPVRDLGISCPHQGPGLALWEQGRAAGRAEVAVVLTDLIEHLRAWERSQRTDPVHNPDYLAWMADRAEARLREVTGDA